MAASQRRLSPSRQVRTTYDLSLVPLPVDVARRMLDGNLRSEPSTLHSEPNTLHPELVEGQPPWHVEYPLSDSLDAIAIALGAHEVVTGKVHEPPTWWVHQIVVDGVVVGDIGFHGPPDSGRTVEIGYSVVPAWRGCGVASGACELILQRAWQDGAEIVIAETDHDNLASQAVLLHNGFRRRSDGVFTIRRPEA